MMTTLTQDTIAAAAFIARVGCPVIWTVEQMDGCAILKIADDDGQTAGYVWMHFPDTGDDLMVHIVADRPWRGFARTIFTKHVVNCVITLGGLMGASRLIGSFANETTARVYERMWSRHTHCYREGASVIHILENPDGRRHKDDIDPGT